MRDIYFTAWLCIRKSRWLHGFPKFLYTWEWLEKNTMEIQRKKWLRIRNLPVAQLSIVLVYFDKISLETLRKSSLMFCKTKMLCKTNACILRAFWSKIHQSEGIDSSLVVLYKEHFIFIGSVDPGVWRWQFKTFWCCYCCWCRCWKTCWRYFDKGFGSWCLVKILLLILGWDFEADAWSRFWSWNLIKYLWYDRKNLHQ